MKNTFLLNANELEVLNLINSKRKTELGVDEGLLNIARERALRLKNNRDIESLKDPFVEMEEREIKYLVAGENIGIEKGIANVIDGFIEKEECKKNIENEGFSKVGIGVENLGEETIVVVMFK
jgi:uncharacterized protein YkwD